MKRRFGTVYMDSQGGIVMHGACTTLYNAVARTAPRVYFRLDVHKAVIVDRMLEIPLLEVCRLKQHLSITMTAEARAAERNIRRVK